jgi:hypothetical protein
MKKLEAETEVEEVDTWSSTYLFLLPERKDWWYWYQQCGKQKKKQNLSSSKAGVWIGGMQWNGVVWDGIRLCSIVWIL